MNHNYHPGDGHHHGGRHHHPPPSNHHHHHHQQNHGQHHRPPPPPPPPPMNADQHQRPPLNNQVPVKWHSFKMLVDPMIHHGATKMVRYDGNVVPGNPHHVSPIPCDPRPNLPVNLWRRLEAMELPCPRFKIDENYVGEPPKLEVTIENLNDNVNEHFLSGMVNKFGEIEEMLIHFHPETRRHLGLARLVFVQVKCAKECVRQLHGKSVMGKQLNCYIDPFGESCKKMFLDLTTEKPLPPLQVPEPEPQLPPEVVEEPPSTRPPPPPPPPDASPKNRRDPRDRRRGSDYREERRDWRKSRDRSSSTDWNDSRQYNNHRDPAYEESGYRQTPYDPQFRGNQTDYWQMQAQQYASMQATDQKSPAVAPPPPSKEAIKSEPAPSIKTETEKEQEGDHVLDLDTRLKMLMKKSTALPSFLAGLHSDEEVKEEVPEIKEEVKPEIPTVFEEDPLLSRPPSPFLSPEIYHQCHQENVAKQKAKFKAQQKRLKHGSRPGSRNSDQMSLSSLSSAENHILEQGPQTAPGLANFYPGYGQYPPPGMPPPQGGWAYPGGPQGPDGYWGGGQPSYYGQSQYQPGGDWGVNAWNDDPYAAYSLDMIRQTANSGPKAVRPILRETTKRFVKELKAQLAIDITKKMCETLAFYLYDDWWQTQEQKYKEKYQSKQQGKSSSSKDEKSISSSTLTTKSPETTTEQKDSTKIPRIPKTEDISTLFDKQRENMEQNRGSTFGKGGSLGFGFRGAMPKLPSFKIQKKQRHSSSEDDRRESRDRRDHDRRKSGAERRRDHEKRREKRMDRRRNESRDRDEEKSRSRKEEPRKESRKSPTRTSVDAVASDSKEPGGERRKTLNDLYNEIYMDSDAEAEKAAKAKGAKTKEPPSKIEDPKKADKKRKEDERWSDSSSSAESSSVAESSDDGSSEESSSDSSARSSSADSSSDGEKSKKKVKKVVKKSSSSADESSVSTSSDESGSEESAKAKETTPKRPPSVYEESPPHIMDHCYAKPLSATLHDKQVSEEEESFADQFANDHGYTRARTPPVSAAAAAASSKPMKITPKPQERKRLQPIMSQPVVPRKKYLQRSDRDEYDILYRFLTKGMNLEDIGYLKRAYEMMLDKKETTKLLNYTHWVDHSVTEIPEPPKKKKSEKEFARKHLTGCCRTEGYYKMDPREKARTKYHLQRNDGFNDASKIANLEGSVTKARPTTSQGQSREARNLQRRQLAVLGDEALNSDLLKFNQLKFRRKNMTFGKSAIHDWGLFAREYIGADEMVIEYVGEVVRPLLSDVREKRYEKQGIGSSYLFRIDQEGGVVDATKGGNLARFINHSCDPNCYAKIITIDGEKKIVIYSKQPIACGEEITYDYKFPIEDEKIRCLCGTKSCRKYLN